MALPLALLVGALKLQMHPQAVHALHALHALHAASAHACPACAPCHASHASLQAFEPTFVVGPVDLVGLVGPGFALGFLSPRPSAPGGS